MSEAKLAEINGMAEEAKRLAAEHARATARCVMTTGENLDAAMSAETAVIAAIDALRDVAVAGFTDPIPAAVHPAGTALELHAAEAGSSSAVNSGSEHQAAPCAMDARDSTESERIDAGDHVWHGPSSEDWLVAYVRGDYLCACGWPESMAKLSDCTLIQKATPEERRALLVSMSTTSGSRGEYARAQLALEEGDPASKAACKPHEASGSDSQSTAQEGNRV